MGDNISLQPPEQFDFTKPDNWIKWKWQFKQFCKALGLTGAVETHQVSILLYTMGENVKKVFISTHILVEDRKSIVL